MKRNMRIRYMEIGGIEYRGIRKILKFLFLISIYLITLYPLSAQPNKTDEKGLKQGLWKQYHENGKLKYEGEFRDNIPVGLFRHYYETGELKMTANYFNNGKSASSYIYYPNGKLEAAGLYTEQKKDSLWKYYNEEEKLIKDEFYNKGKENGTFKTYYANGNVVEEINWKNGVKDGAWKKYYEDGKPRQEAFYLSGTLDGDFKIYTDEGKPFIEGKYNKDKKAGIWYYYTGTGAIEKIEKYRDGNLFSEQMMNGKKEEFYKNNIPKSSVNYSNGKKSGLFSEWYEAGEWKKKLIKGQEGEDDQWQEYLEGQVVKRTGKYVNDRLEGEVIYYNPDGSIAKKEMYKAGVLVN